MHEVNVVRTHVVKSEMFDVAAWIEVPFEPMDDDEVGRVFGHHSTIV